MNFSHQAINRFSRDRKNLQIVCAIKTKAVTVYAKRCSVHLKINSYKLLDNLYNDLALFHNYRVVYLKVDDPVNQTVSVCTKKYI